jgi:hypothetical protein
MIGWFIKFPGVRQMLHWTLGLCRMQNFADKYVECYASETTTKCVESTEPGRYTVECHWRTSPYQVWKNYKENAAPYQVWKNYKENAAPWWTSFARITECFTWVTPGINWVQRVSGLVVWFLLRVQEVGSSILPIPLFKGPVRCSGTKIFVSFI